MGGYVGIPTSYTPVEYIESTGTQYIDTGVYPSSSSKVELDYQLTGTTTSLATTNILRASNGADIPSFSCGCAGGGGNANNARFCFGSNYSYYVDFTGLNNTNRHTVKVDCVNSNVVVDSTSTYNVTRSTFTCTSTMSLPAQGAVLKIYSCKIYEYDVLVRDFIPVVNQDNVACLYEQVEGRLYYNKGAGTFTAGSATGQSASIGGRARTLKKGYAGVSSSYTPIEYLESTGTQYINTGVKPNANIHCVVDFQFTAVAQGGVIGGWESNKGMLFGINSSNFQFAFGTSAWGGNTLVADTNRHTLYMNDDDGNARVDSTILAYGSNVTSLANTNRAMWLFRSNGGVGFAKLKIYSCQIYDGTTLIRNYIPSIDEANRVCLYDTVESKFYYNLGSDEFLIGQTTGQTVNVGIQNKRLLTGYVGVPTSYTPVEYVQNSGTQYIDTGIIPNFTNGFKIEIKVEPSVLGVRYSPISNFNGSTSVNFSGEITANNEARFYMNAGALDIKQTGIVLGENTIVWEYYNGNYKLTVNGTSKTGTYTTSGANSESLLLFVDRAFRFSTFNQPLKLFYCKIYEGDTLIRDFIPVIDQDGVACLYDLVGDNLYYSAGAGTFAAGSTAGQPVNIGGKARKCFVSNIVPKGTIFLCNCDDNATNQIDGVETRPYPTSSGTFSFSVGKWGKQIQIKNTEISGSYQETVYQYSLRDGLLPSLYNIFQGTANPITLTCWKAGNAQNDGWSIAYGYGWFSRAEGYYARAYRCAAGVDISNNYLRIKIMYRNNSIQTASYLTDVPSTVYNDGQFHHYALEINQYGVSFYFDGVYKGTLAKPRYIHFRWYEQYDTIFKGR